jgi:hypothetical protein
MGDAQHWSSSNLARGASSWIHVWIKDRYEDRFGIVVNVDRDDEGRVRLLARFLGEDGLRAIALEPVADGHYLDPSDSKARYRRLSRSERLELLEITRRRES